MPKTMPADSRAQAETAARKAQQRCDHELIQRDITANAMRCCLCGTIVRD